MAQASQAVRDAAAAQAQAMAQARQANAPGIPGMQGSPTAANGQGQGHGQGQGQGQGQPGQGQGQGQGQPGQGGQGGQVPGTGAQVEAPPTAAGDLPAADALKRGDWGRLPPRLARELLEGQRDDVTGEYRAQVEAYFRAIAQKARQKESK
jgi:hypothetical protein